MTRLLDSIVPLLAILSAVILRNEESPAAAASAADTIVHESNDERDSSLCGAQNDTHANVSPRREAMSTEIDVSIRDIVKHFGAMTAVDHVSLDIHRGQFV